MRTKRSTLVASLAIGSTVATSALADDPSGYDYDADVDQAMLNVGDWCTQYLPTVETYFSEPNQAKWPKSLNFMKGRQFSEKAPPLKGFALAIELKADPIAAVTTVTGTGTRVIRYEPEAGSTNLHAVNVCEYRRTAGAVPTLQVVHREAFLSQPNNSIAGVQSRSFPQTHADPRIFAVFTRPFRPADYALGLVFIGEGYGRFTISIGADAVAGPIPLTPHAPGTPIAPNAVVDFLQPTDTSQTGPYASWDHGKFAGIIPLYLIGGKRSAQTISQKAIGPYLSMLGGAAKAGFTLKINSAFRDYPMQQYLWECYQSKKCNGGHTAAKAGSSNHQSGIALDLEMGMGVGTSTNADVSKWTAVYKWMVENARLYGFMRTVENEAWHWEYRPDQAAKDGTFGGFSALSAAKTTASKK